MDAEEVLNFGNGETWTIPLAWVCAEIKPADKQIEHYEIVPYQPE